MSCGLKEELASNEVWPLQLESMSRRGRCRQLEHRGSLYLRANINPESAYGGHEYSGSCEHGCQSGGHQCPVSTQTVCRCHYPQGTSTEFPARLSTIPKRPVSTRLNILGTHQLLLTLYFTTAVKYTQQNNAGELHPRCQSSCSSLRLPNPSNGMP